MPTVDPSGDSTSSNSGPPPPPSGGTGGGTASSTAKAKPKKKRSQEAGHGTPQWFARKVLERLGLPVTRSNVNWLTAWESREGGHWGNTARYNPLNTTLPMPGSSTMNGVGVRVYTSWQQGIEATAKTLESGLYNDIRGALSTGHVSLDHHFHSLIAWSGGGYDNVSGGTVNYHPTGGGMTGSAPADNPGDYLNKNVEAQYGYLAAYLHNPEIGPILREAAAQGWSENRLLSALEKTSWWKTTSQTAREMGALKSTDPATYRQQWGQMRNQVGTLATSMGLHVDGDRLNQIATTALYSGWSPMQIQQAVGAEFHYNPNAKYTGTAGKTIQQFKQMAGEYLTPLDNHTLAQWTRQALEGKVNPDDFTGYLAKQAQTLFPWMAKAIDKGISPTQYLQPYQQAAAQTLELDPGKIDFTSAKWRNLFETVDPKTGDRSERGLANAMTLMRTDPRYGYDWTQGAKQEAAGLAQQIAQSFGFAA